MRMHTRLAFDALVIHRAGIILIPQPLQNFPRLAVLATPEVWAHLSHAVKIWLGVKDT